MAVEYGFYVFFTLCLLCIVVVLEAERLRVAGRPKSTIFVEKLGRYVFALGVFATAGFGWSAYAYS
jgi:hypothetical protein